VRELREFRVHHDELSSEGIAVAGVSREAPAVNRAWVERLRLPYPLLADTQREAGPAFGVIQRIGLGGFALELFRRTTFLIDRRGVVMAVWEQVRIRGHAREVLDVARALRSTPA
jgi:peroxiredoxin Q/BCP